jgi:hypothetical protein
VNNPEMNKLDFCDVFSLTNGREIRILWPCDLLETDITDILAWLEIIERKIVRSSNENERGWVRP